MSWPLWALVALAVVVLAAVCVRAFRRAGRDFDRIVGQVDTDRRDEVARRRRLLAQRDADGRRRRSGEV